MSHSHNLARARTVLTRAGRVATFVTKDGWSTVAKRIIHKQKLSRDGGQGQQLGGEHVFELGEGQGVKQPGLEVEEELAGLGEGGG